VGRALGEFEQLILFALVELEDEAYGAAIGRAIEDRTGRNVSAGAVYTALDRLETRGLVTSRVGEPRPQRGGRRRKYYDLEPEGAVELRRSVHVIREMSKGLMGRLATLAEERRA
jgi:PadR family transcriptional regulator PadR